MVFFIPSRTHCSTLARTALRYSTINKYRVGNGHHMQKFNKMADIMLQCALPAVTPRDLGSNVNFSLYSGDLCTLKQLPYRYSLPVDCSPVSPPALLTCSLAHLLLFGRHDELVPVLCML